MYIQFYNPTTYKKNNGIPLSYYGKVRDNSTLLEYINYYGGINGTDVMMIYCII